MTYLNNWRPLSLLNTDYKIIEKVVSIKLQKIIDNLTLEDLYVVSKKIEKIEGKLQITLEHQKKFKRSKLYYVFRS